MRKITTIISPLPVLLSFHVLALLGIGQPVHAQENGEYTALLALFEEWREFESPPLLDGAPDYTAERFDDRYGEYRELRARLDGFDIDDWPVARQVDWHLVRAEMNGFQFNYRVLRPWARDN